MAIVDDPEVDLGVLAGRFGAWLRQQPGQSRSAVASLRQASASNGFSNETYRVTVAGPRRPDRELILRLPPARTGLFPHYDIPRQWAFMQGLQSAPGLRLAPCLWLEPGTAALGRPFFVTDFVDGDVAGDNPCYLNQGWIVDATPDQRRRLWDGALSQLRHLATVRWRRSALARVDWPDRARPRWAQHLALWAALAAWGRAQLPDDGDDPLLGELARWLLAQAPRQERAGIVWGDARLGNMICRDFEPVALLDWELAVIGDPMLDLAYFLFHVGLKERLHGLPRLPGFGTDAEAVAGWCEVARRSPRDYRACWLFNAFKMLCIWQCKSALMVRSGAWSVDEGLAARRGPRLRPQVRDVLDGDAASAWGP